jgi:hypothetical protein
MTYHTNQSRTNKTINTKNTHNIPVKLRYVRVINLEEEGIKQ